MFKDRQDAGKNLAIKLERFIKSKNFLVVGITRGGVVLGRVIADYFKMRLAALVIKKIGAPNNSELAIGAIGPKKIVYWNDDLIRQLGITKEYKIEAKKAKSKEVERLESVFNKGKKHLDYLGKQVILVDDGIATGATVLCAQKFLQKERVREIILASAVMSKNTMDQITRYFGKLVVLEVVDDFYSVGQFFKNFPQVEDEEVIEILRE